MVFSEQRRLGGAFGFAELGFDLVAQHQRQGAHAARQVEVLGLRGRDFERHRVHHLGLGLVAAGFLRHRQHQDSLEHDLADGLVLVAAAVAFVDRVDHDVDVIARQREAGHTDDVVDAHGHGALAVGHHRREAALGAHGGELAFDDGLAARDRRLDDPPVQLCHLRKGARRHAARGPLDHAQHFGHEFGAELHVHRGHRNVAAALGLRLHPARGKGDGRSARHERDQ